MGRITEAQVEFSRALSLDPVSVIANMDAARPFYASRDYQRAAEQLHKAIEIDPNFHRAHALLAHCYTQMLKYDDALKEAQQALALAPPREETTGNPPMNYQLAYIYARAGQVRESQRVMKYVGELPGAINVGPYFRPLAYAALGETERAFASLEQLYQLHDPELLGIRPDPAWDLLRGDQRFERLLHRIGLSR